MLCCILVSIGATFMILCMQINGLAYQDQVAITRSFIYAYLTIICIMEIDVIFFIEINFNMVHMVNSPYDQISYLRSGL